MLFSLAMMVIVALGISGILVRCRLPGLIGMLLTGMLLGPYGLNQIVPELLNISAELRTMALIVILARAGLALDWEDLKQVGRPAVFMSFVPASFEILATTLLAPRLFSISYVEAAIMGTVLGAVSPAVIVPKMLQLMEKGLGTAKRIPQLILAGASVDDIFVIVLFTSFMGLAQGDSANLWRLIQIPVAILIGITVGVIIGQILIRFFKAFHMRDTVKILLILSVAFLLVSQETAINRFLPMSALLAVMAIGGTIFKGYGVLAKRLAVKFSKVWVVAELMLFVLVGATVDLTYLWQAGTKVIMLIGLVLLARLVGVMLSLLGSDLSGKERLFCAIAYVPKATVQAAIGSIPLAAGLSSGSLILTVAVVSILVTAPLGAIGMDRTERHFLTRS